MSFVGSFLRLFGVGKLAPPQTGAQSSGNESRGTESGIVVSDERALQVAAVWSCVRLISETVASLPLGFYRTVGNDRVPLERTHPVVELFSRRPNAMMTPLEFREAMTCQIALWGNAYAAIEWIGNRPVSITPLRPETVTPVRAGGELTYHVSTDKGITVLSKRSVLHLKGFSTTGTVGLSPLAHARQVLGLTVSADKYAAANFLNGGRPGGVLTLDRFLDPKQRELVRELYSNMSATADNAGKLWVLEGGMKYESISIPPDDMQMLESRQFQLGEIARIFRVPSHLINDTEKSTSWGTGIEQLNLGFLQYTLRPYLTRWESTLRDSLLLPEEREAVVIEHNVEGLLRADSAARSAFYSTMAQNGLMTRNEIRRKENLPAMTGGDELTAQVNLAPLDKLGAPAPAAPAPSTNQDASPRMVRSDPIVLSMQATAPAPAAPGRIHVDVAPPSVTVNTGSGGRKSQRVTEFDCEGVPSAIVTTETRTTKRYVTEWDEKGMPLKAAEVDLTWSDAEWP